MILAADVGGSKTLVGLFERVAPRPRLIEARTVRTLDYPDLLSLLNAACPIGPEVDAIALGVAGPIVEHEATLTNVPWRVRARDVVEGTGVARLRLLNDLEAMAYAVPVLAPDELHTLQAGRTSAHGNAALIAAGTGLGEATLHRVDGAWRPVPSEAGHADFAARTDAELALVAALRERYGRVDVERVVSGLGLINLARHVHGADRCPVAGGFAEDGATARVSDAAAAGTCPDCRTVLEMFVDAYGAEAGNLALRAVATAGVYIGGGIAPKILPFIEARFMATFRDKAPMDGLLANVPVHVILNDQAGLVGAAVAALA
ncbi:MAG: glucokinase [Vicinamibacterales bacterium]